MRHDPFDDEFHFIRIKGFHEIIEGPLLHGLHRGIHGGEGGHHDDLGFLVNLLESLEGFKSVHAWHFQVKEDNVPFVGPGHFNGLLSARREADFIVILHEPVLE